MFQTLDLEAVHGVTLGSQVRDTLQTLLGVGMEVPLGVWVQTPSEKIRPAATLDHTCCCVATTKELVVTSSTTGENGLGSPTRSKSSEATLNDARRCSRWEETSVPMPEVEPKVCSCRLGCPDAEGKDWGTIPSRAPVWPKSWQKCFRAGHGLEQRCSGGWAGWRLHLTVPPMWTEAWPATPLSSPSWATWYRWGAAKVPALEGAKAGGHRAEGPWRGLLFPPSHRELPRQVPPKMRGEVRGSPQQLLASFDPTKPVLEGPNRLY